jgi:chemotaxis protein MotB
MVTLLMVFFIVLYTMTPGIDKSQFENFISYFQSSMGVIESNTAVNQKSERSEDYREEIMDDWLELQKYIEKEQLNGQVEIEEVETGVKITLSDSLTFNSGSSDLLPRAERVLDEIANVFSDEIAETEVQGHTDTDPIASSSYYRSNWHLGAARGVSVLKYIQERSSLEPERYKASSFGEFHPIAENSTVKGKRKNRRVEIYVRYKGLLNQDSGNTEIPADGVVSNAADISIDK